MHIFFCAKNVIVSGNTIIQTRAASASQLLNRLSRLKTLNKAKKNNLTNLRSSKFDFKCLKIIFLTERKYFWYLDECLSAVDSASRQE